MEFKDLTPIITLLTEQETRMCKKIDDVHDDVKETNAKITQQNGRLRRVEVKLAERDTYCEMRSQQLDKELESLEPIKNTVKLFTFVAKNPKITGLILLGSMYLTMILTIIAIDKQWIGHIFKALIP